MMVTFNQHTIGQCLHTLHHIFSLMLERILVVLSADCTNRYVVGRKQV